MTLSNVNFPDNCVYIFPVGKWKGKDFIVIDMAFQFAEVYPWYVVDVDDVAFVYPEKIERKGLFKVFQRLVGIYNFPIHQLDISGIIIGF